MLAGQPPFTGPNAAAIMARQALEMPPSLTVVRSTIPDEVEDAIFQALAKSPVDRYESARRLCRRAAGLSHGGAHRHAPRDGTAHDA